MLELFNFVMNLGVLGDLSALLVLSLSIIFVFQPLRQKGKIYYGMTKTKDFIALAMFCLIYALSAYGIKDGLVWYILAPCFMWVSGWTANRILCDNYKIARLILGIAVANTPCECAAEMVFAGSPGSPTPNPVPCPNALQRVATIRFMGVAAKIV